MAQMIATEQGIASPTRRLRRSGRIISSTDFLDLSYDTERLALWIYLSARAPAYVSLELIEDLLSVDNIFATSLAANPDIEPQLNFKIIASKRPGVFSLGGDLASFRFHIDQGDRNALTRYANAALDAIWTNTQAAGIDGMTTISLVEGEAQGGGFEAALSAHVLVAEKGAMFGFPEALFGMFPGMGGYALLSARTSEDSAKRLIGSTNRYPAEMLYEMGVIDILAEPGRGRETLNDWMSAATPQLTARYRSRFGHLDRRLLAESIDEWVEQALCLNQRQLRTMGYILAAQKRASAKIISSNVTPLRRKIGFDDIVTTDLLEDTRCGTPSPLLVTPRTAKRYNETEFLAFSKISRPWIYENLSRYGALLLRGFSTGDCNALNRLTAALRVNRKFSAQRTVPTPENVHDNVFIDITGMYRPLSNAYSDCAIFPGYKVLARNVKSDSGPMTVTLANTHSIYQQLDHDLVLEFERRGITYTRLFPTRRTTQQRGDTWFIDHFCWENVFKTSRRAEVEKKCRENGLHYKWRRDGSITVWNSAPACISHHESHDRLWFNQIHLYFSLADKFRKKKPGLYGLFGGANSTPSVTATFSDGAAISQAYISEISAVHTGLTIDIELKPGDLLLLDNTLSAQGHAAPTNTGSCLFTLY